MAREVRSEVSVFTWGFGKFGQLGVGSTDTCLTPQRITLPFTCCGVHSGGLFTAIVTEQGTLYTFGCGKHGRLGTLDDVDRLVPVQVKGNLAKQKVTQVSCGSWHGAALAENGDIYVWGYGKSHGVLGLPNCPAVASPTKLLGPFSEKVAGVACGNNFTLIWTTDGECYSWGCGRHGVLGHGDINDRGTPTRISSLGEELVVSMSAGFVHCGAVTAAGTLYMFGKGVDGALGLGDNSKNAVTLPTRLISLEGYFIKEVSCSVGEHHGHTLMVTADGKVFSCGDGYKGKLGLGDQEPRALPSLIPQEHFLGEAIEHVSAGGIHSAAVSTEGHIFTWGCGSDGRLGHPDAQGHRYLFRSDVPRVVECLIDVGKGLTVTCSYYHTVALVRNCAPVKIENGT